MANPPSYLSYQQVMMFLICPLPQPFFCFLGTCFNEGRVSNSRPSYRRPRVLPTRPRPLRNNTLTLRTSTGGALYTLTSDISVLFSWSRDRIAFCNTGSTASSSVLACCNENKALMIQIAIWVLFLSNLDFRLSYLETFPIRPKLKKKCSGFKSQCFKSPRF